MLFAELVQIYHCCDYQMLFFKEMLAVFSIFSFHFPDAQKVNMISTNRDSPGKPPCKVERDEGFVLSLCGSACGLMPISQSQMCSQSLWSAPALLAAPNRSAIFEFELPDLRFQFLCIPSFPYLHWSSQSSPPPPLLVVLMEIITAEWNSRFPWMSV